MPKAPGLEYQANVPAFLQRIKAGHASLDGRHDVQIPRARGGIGRNERLRMDGDEGEDDPLMIDETGNVVSKEDMEAMTTTDTKTETQLENSMSLPESQNGSKASRASKSQNPTVISGIGKKRKAVKVIGEQEESNAHSPAAAEESEEMAPTKSLKQSTKDLKHAVQTNKDALERDGTNAAVIRKQKKKKIKLSFDDAETT